MNELNNLVGQFEFNIEQYKGKSYDEAKTRADFIDKFFHLLGWDIYNAQGYSEQYREVVREDKIPIKGKVNAPDYCFRIGSERKFFVEAKKPAVDIKHDITPAFQLRRYAYTAKLPLSILTDFEEFAIYDTRIKPDKNDGASTARIFYCTYKEYNEQIDFISQTFSREAILKGSFDKYIEENKGKKGTSEVDKEFLKLIEIWREDLAKNIALRNKDLSIYELNYVVQAIIDRIIFLRIAEDRQIETYGQLQELLETKSAIYPGLVKLFYQADGKYNSGLFDFHKDTISTKLAIDDRVFRDIIKSLYYPDSPYEFSVFDVQILGNIYEQFLGKTIRLTASHQAKVEDKPEVKKAGGVYYTPKYIVDYIVRNTVGEKIKDKKPEDIAQLRILDPACGSGSFLLGAYRLLLDYHLNYYTGGHGDKKLSASDKQLSILKKAEKENRVYVVGEGEYRLTFNEKRQILANNIFGVDIDRQAVEVTKLSLLLKLLEGESGELKGMLIRYSDKKLLPDLSGNIKSGNSLIGSDFYQQGQMSLFQDEETVRRINVFDWQEEFPEIFKQGGFDVVIGNPPYGAQFSHEIRHYLSNEYGIPVPITDSFVVFLLKSLSIVKQNGYQSFIIPSSWLYMTSFINIRKGILLDHLLKEVLLFREFVFPKVTVETCIEVIINRSSADYQIKFIEIANEPAAMDGVTKLIEKGVVLANREILLYQGRNELSTNLFEKMLNDYDCLGKHSTII
ncbi:MAG: N-6 DNA methylase [Candidatus Aminicenantes bacterium]|nr:N-6 DNA methylase [Candidatus Aminicenantes bacterium]